MLLVDTNVLLDVLQDDPQWADWSIGQLRAQAGVFSGGVVHGHNQVPLLFRHPCVPAAVLVQHHPRQRSPLPLAPVFALAFGARHRVGFL